MRNIISNLSSSFSGKSVETPEEHNFEQILTDLQKVIHDRHKNVGEIRIGEYSFSGDEVTTTSIGICNNKGLFIFFEYFKCLAAHETYYFTKCSFGDTNKFEDRKRIEPDSDFRRRKILQFYEERFLDVLRSLHNGTECKGKNEKKSVGYISINSTETYLNQIYNTNTNTYNPEKVDYETLIHQIDCAIYSSIAFSKDLRIPASNRTKALKKIHYEDEPDYATTLHPKSVFPQRPRLPIKFTPPVMIGQDVDHNLEHLTGQDFIEFDPNSFRGRGADNKIIELFQEVIQKYPLNALQFYMFLIQQSEYNLTGDIKLLKFFQGCDESVLERVFNEKASYFTETDDDVFSSQARMRFNDGSLSAVEEEPSELPKDLQEAIQLITSLQNQIRLLEQKYRTYKKEQGSTELGMREEIERLRAQIQPQEWMAVFQPFHISRDFLMENIFDPEKRNNIKDHISIIHAGRISKLKKIYDNTELSTTGTEGFYEFQRINTEKNLAIDFLNQVIIR